MKTNQADFLVAQGELRAMFDLYSGSYILWRCRFSYSAEREPIVKGVKLSYRLAKFKPTPSTRTLDLLTSILLSTAVLSVYINGRIAM